MLLVKPHMSKKKKKEVRKTGFIWELVKDFTENQLYIFPQQMYLNASNFRNVDQKELITYFTNEGCKVDCDPILKPQYLLLKFLKIDIGVLWRENARRK